MAAGVSSLEIVSTGDQVFISSCNQNLLVSAATGKHGIVFQAKDKAIAVPTE
jgi:hypothetical protein